MPLVVLVLIKDLIFSSKIRATAQSLGVPVQIVREPDKLDGLAGDRLIVDLNQPGALEAAIRWREATHGCVVGFVSHIDQQTIDRARAAGVDRILARSAFVEQLGELLQ
jgi:AmiR/NasT family two-component response regulator